MSTHIQWTDETWNPVAGCRKVSAGCDHCYAIRDAHRLAGNAHPQIAATYAGLTQVQNGRLNWTGTFRELPERLDQPLRWTRPRRVFVNSMSDLFGEGISADYIARVFGAMAAATPHQFQVLTKRPERMQELLGGGRSGHFWGEVSQTAWELLRTRGGPADARQAPPLPHPLPHVWLGTSVEHQLAATQRIPALLSTPAAVRFLSCEPLLGPLDLLQIGPGGNRYHDWLTGERLSPLEKDHTPGLHWVIAGGESGPGARPMQIEWLEALRDQCRAAGVPLFIKQMGSVWAHTHGAAHSKGGDPAEWPAELRIRGYPAQPGQPEDHR